MQITPFKVDVPQSVLNDLQARLAHTRWPDQLPDADWDYGTELGYMQELAAYWQTQFDWRTQERLINSFAHHRADIDGLNIHFIHERGQGPNPLPIILTHGWPGSFFEMYKLIPLLTDPAHHGGDAAAAFDVIVPSLPGFGFSDRLPRRGMTSFDIADLWAKLMTEGLGYQRFAAHGGDIGAGVTTRLGFRHPEHVIGIHVTAVADPPLDADSLPLSDAEQAFMEVIKRWEADEGGYSHIESTRPQTLGYGLTDSPVGLAAWIVEKYRAWSDCDGDIERRFSKDELLTNATIYWVTETINSSIRLYYEHEHHLQPFKVGDRIHVPCGIALTREAVDLAPRTWAERLYNVQHWTELPSGGHFAALEEPQLLAEDIRAFFRELR